MLLLVSREDVGGIVFCLGMLGFLIIAAAMLDRYQPKIARTLGGQL